MSKKNLLRILISVSISGLCLYLVTKNVNWKELSHILTNAKILPIFLGTFVSLVTFFLRALRWRILLSPFQHLPLGALARWQIGGLFVNNFFPLRMGEFARAYWAGHKSSIAKSTVFATIFLERIFDLLSIALLALLFLSATNIYDWRQFLRSENFALFGLVILTLLLLGYFFLKRCDKETILQILRTRLPQTIARLAENFLKGLKIIKSKTQIGKVTFLSLLIWCVDIVVLSIISQSLGLNLTFIEGGVLMAGLILGVMIPAAPGAIGTYEAGGVSALSLLGIDKTLALSFVLLLHGVQCLFIACLGVPVLMLEGFSPKKIIENNEAVSFS